jgi:GNAT superfamily N-acetyltransferase
MAARVDGVPKFEIRRATTRDLRVLVDHRHTMFEEMAHPTEDELEVLDASYDKWARDMMKRGLFHGYIVTTAKKGEPAASGCVWLREVQPSPGRPAGFIPYILSVYTRPEFRRNGLASMIMKEAMGWAREEGYPMVLLHASKTGKKVYTKLGWKRTTEMEFQFEE